uniref:C-type lectin domain-containing protein n=1 Tax=Sinocyclocheilus grahami TaxID=75366 RepID=A0A672KH86_SINGR
MVELVLSARHGSGLHSPQHGGVGIPFPIGTSRVTYVTMCYYYSTVKMNWTQSRDHCVTLGGHLVIINSKAEQDFVTSNVEETHWIGLNDVDTEGHWVWIFINLDNKSFALKNETSEPDNWTKFHPDGEDCAGLGHPGAETDFWMDAYCFEEKRFVCEAAAAV